MASLETNRKALIHALEVLGEESLAVSEGAIYLWAKLPRGFEDDTSIVVWIVKKHGVCLIPRSSCGAPGHIRVAFANLEPEMCHQAASRLQGGVEDMLRLGMHGVYADLKGYDDIDRIPNIVGVDDPCLSETTSIQHTDQHGL